MSIPIAFADLAMYNNGNSFVWTGLTYNQSEQYAIEAWLREIDFLPPEARILDMKPISGNVRGKEGRSDVLFITTPARFDPIARLRVHGLTWTSDFIANHGADYGVPGQKRRSLKKRRRT